MLWQVVRIENNIESCCLLSEGHVRILSKTKYKLQVRIIIQNIRIGVPDMNSIQWQGILTKS